MIPTLSNEETTATTRDASSPAAGGLRSGAFGALLAYAASRATLAYTGDPVAGELAGQAAEELLAQIVIPGVGFALAFLATAGRKALADRNAAAAR